MTAALFFTGCKSPLLSLTEPPQVEESERPDAPETLGFLLVGFLPEGNDEYIRNTALLLMVQKSGDHQLIW